MTEKYANFDLIFKIWESLSEQQLFSSTASAKQLRSTLPSEAMAEMALLKRVSHVITRLSKQIPLSHLSWPASSSDQSDGSLTNACHDLANLDLNLFNIVLDCFSEAHPLPSSLTQLLHFLPLLTCHAFN